MPVTNNKLTSPRLSHPWTSRRSTQEATLRRSLLFSLQMQILLKRSHRREMAVVAKRHIKARATKINIINETRTVQGIIISSNMEEEIMGVVKEDLKDREVITIRVDMAMVAPLLETREQVVVVGEWVVETVDMVTTICKEVGVKVHIPTKITSMPILKQSLAV